MKDYGFIFRDDKELSKKAKVISELTKDISEYIFDSIKLDIKLKEKNIKSLTIQHALCNMVKKFTISQYHYWKKQKMKF